MGELLKRHLQRLTAQAQAVMEAVRLSGDIDYDRELRFTHHYASGYLYIMQDLSNYESIPPSRLYRLACTAMRSEPRKHGGTEYWVYGVAGAFHDLLSLEAVQ